MDYPILQTLNDICDHLDQDSIESILINTKPNNFTSFSSHRCFFFPLEKHRFYEVAIQIAGECEIQVEDRFYPLRKGQIMLIDKGVTHRLGIEDACMMLWVGATNETIRAGVSTYSNCKRRKEWAQDINAPGAYLIYEILREIEGKDCCLKTISKYLAAFVMMLSRKIHFIEGLNAADEKTRVVDELKSYIAIHLKEGLSLETLAMQVGISPNYLCTIFKDREHETIMNYIQDRKIKLGSRMLIESDDKLSEIAKALGYYDQFHFSKVFKKFIGVSPTAYRQAQKHPVKE